MAKLYDTETQLKVLALLARGDTHAAISEAMDIPVTSISGIKQRNSQALAVIQERMVTHQASKSKKLLDKAHDLIESKLDRSAKAEEIRHQAFQDFHDGLIEKEELRARIDTIEEATLKDLTSVAREMFNQSQIESGKPTSISNSPVEAKAELLKLVEAIKEGDEVQLFKMVLNPERHATIIEGELADDESVGTET